MSPALVLTNPALLQYLAALGAGGTYAMNRDKINRMAGSFRFPWPRRESAEERWLRTGSYEEPTVITARPDATNSEMDARQIISSGGGPGGNKNDDDLFMRNARYTALGEIPSVFSKLFSRARDVDPYEAGRIEREEQEWGPGGQPSASDQIDAYERSKWLQKTRNSPAQRSGAFTDDELWQQQLKHRQWLEDNNRI